MESSLLDNNDRQELRLATAEKQVEELYHFRDHYFECNDANKACSKAEEVRLRLTGVMDFLTNNKDTLEQEDKAKYCWLIGRALNVKADFDLQALESLTKSVKLSPKLVEAWNELGECYWKKGDILAAKNCFEGALKHTRNKVSLRSLSMVLRQLDLAGNERLDAIYDGVEKAKEAVELDIEDGMSWYILGNAYLNLFFMVNQNHKILRNCMVAYSKAMQDPVMKCNPDLFYNRATALRYEEQYQESLECYEQASILDPLWNDPKEKVTNLLSYLETVQEMIHKKGSLKTRAIQNLRKTLKPHHLGQLADGYTSLAGKFVKLDLVSLSQLDVGLNAKKVVMGKVVCSIVSADPVPFTFCILHEEICLSVTVYNLAEGRGVIIGDSVAIPEPFLQQVKVKYKGNDIQYSTIRVDSPLLLVVNGRRMNADNQALTKVAVTVKSE